jgi:hypothetical protein
MASDYSLPEVSARNFAERREFRFGEVAREMAAKARGLFADPDRIAALRGRLDKALGREPSASPETKRGADKEPGQDRGTDSATSRLRARMAELGKQVRKDDERERDRTKDRDLDRGGPGR